MKTSEFEIGQYYRTTHIINRMLTRDIIMKVEAIKEGRVFWKDIFRGSTGSIKTTATTFMTKQADPISDSETKKFIFEDIFELRPNYYSS